MASEKDIKVIRKMAAKWGGTLPGTGKPNFSYGVMILGDAMRALCRQRAEKARKLGDQAEALRWEIRAAFFFAAAHR